MAAVVSSLSILSHIISPQKLKFSGLLLSLSNMWIIARSVPPSALISLFSETVKFHLRLHSNLPFPSARRTEAWHEIISPLIRFHCRLLSLLSKIHASYWFWRPSFIPKSRFLDHCSWLIRSILVTARVSSTVWSSPEKYYTSLFESHKGRSPETDTIRGEISNDYILRPSRSSSSQIARWTSRDSARWNK
jgi:hypothetical protein